MKPSKKFPTEKKYDVTYLLYDTSKWGGVKGTFVQANGLTARGYKVCVVAKTPAPDWFELKCDFLQSPGFDSADIPDSDIVIGTWFPTVAVAFAANKGIPVHYCRGYEAQDANLPADAKNQIAQVYELPTVKIANSPHVAELLRANFNTDAYVVKNDINHEIFYPQREKTPADKSQKLRVLIVGPYEVAWKGIKDCLDACAILTQEYGVKVEVVRVSQTPFTEAERQQVSGAPYQHSYHQNFSEQEMAALYNDCDVLLSGSYPTVESFGRPVMEALACGLPAVATDIPAYRDYAETDNYALFVTPGGFQAMAEAVHKIINDAELRDSLIKHGFEVSRSYGVEQTLDDLERVLADIYAGHASGKSQPSGSPNYYEFTRPEVQAMVPETAKTILDVGCASGKLGHELKTKLGAEVWGIEYVPDVAQQARNVLDKVYAGDINEVAPSLPENYFDAIIFADVLEHLPDPAETLKLLSPALSQHGKLIISIPNVRHWSVVKGLLEGFWEYEEAGLLDRTHLRFFTRRSFEKLLNNLGFKPVLLHATRNTYPPIPTSIVIALQQEGLDVSTLAEESQIYQWLYLVELLDPLKTELENCIQMRKAGKLKEAVAHLKPLLKAHPQNGKLLREFTMICILLGEFERAFHFFRRILTLPDAQQFLDLNYVLRLQIGLQQPVVPELPQISEETEGDWAQHYLATNEDILYPLELADCKVVETNKATNYVFHGNCTCCGHEAEISISCAVLEQRERFCCACFARQLVDPKIAKAFLEQKFPHLSYENIRDLNAEQ